MQRGFFLLPWCHSPYVFDFKSSFLQEPKNLIKYIFQDKELWISIAVNAGNSHPIEIKGQFATPNNKITNHTRWCQIEIRIQNITADIPFARRNSSSDIRISSPSIRKSNGSVFHSGLSEHPKIILYTSIHNNYTRKNKLREQTSSYIDLPLSPVTLRGFKDKTSKQLKTITL